VGVEADNRPRSGDERPPGSERTAPTRNIEMH